MKKIATIPMLLLVAVLSMAASDESCGTPTADRLQREAQEKINKEGNAATGMPAIKNFRMRKLLKDIIELQDQDGLVTYTYTFSEMTGKYTFFCNSFGYGIPYATQYTNPQKPLYDRVDTTTIAQADPDGLFKPASAEGTWVMCKDPNGKEVRPIYVEPRLIVSPFKLQE